MYIICLVLIVIFILCKIDLRKIHLYFKNLILFNLIGTKAIIEDKRYASSNIKLKYQRNGDIAVVTGGSRGIGFEIVKSFLEMNMTVIIGCRNLLTAEKAVKSIREMGIIGGNAECIHLDTSSLNSVRKFADTVKTKYEFIHILVNNAGILFCPFNLTEDGFEYTFSTNYLGHALLTHLLLPNLIKAGEARYMNSRVINVSSVIYEIGSINLQNINLIDNYSPDIAYAQSKLAQLLFTITLNEKLKYKNAPVQVHAVHPGIVNSNLFEKTWLKSTWLTKLIFKSPEEGARSIIFASLHYTLEDKAGNYISNCQVFETTKVAKDKIVQESLWNLTLEMLKIQNFGNVL